MLGEGKGHHTRTSFLRLRRDVSRYRLCTGYGEKCRTTEIYRPPVCFLLACCFLRFLSPREGEIFKTQRVGGPVLDPVGPGLSLAWPDRAGLGRAASGLCGAREQFLKVFAFRGGSGRYTV